MSHMPEVHLVDKGNQCNHAKMINFSKLNPVPNITSYMRKFTSIHVYKPQYSARELMN